MMEEEPPALELAPLVLTVVVESVHGGPLQIRYHHQPASRVLAGWLAPLVVRLVMQSRQLRVVNVFWNTSERRGAVCEALRYDDVHGHSWR
jgi:hypothetical protein